MLRVKDLKRYTGTKGERPFLLCDDCGGEYSAERGDYFNAPPGLILQCCERPMRRVFKRTVYKEDR